MGKAKVFLYRVGLFVLFVLVVYGMWWWGERRAEQRVAEQANEYVSQVRLLREAADAWGLKLADSEAEAVFRAFTAGIHPAILSGRRESIDQAVGALLELQDVAFVHVLQPDGNVIASSDRKLTTTGQAGEGAAWALSAQELVRRPGELSGTLELAAPILGASGSEAVVWLGYDTGALKERTRPSGLSAAATPAPR